MVHFLLISSARCKKCKNIYVTAPYWSPRCYPGSLGRCSILQVGPGGNLGHVKRWVCGARWGFRAWTAFLLNIFSSKKEEKGKFLFACSLWAAGKGDNRLCFNTTRLSREGSCGFLGGGLGVGLVPGLQGVKGVLRLCSWVIVLGSRQEIWKH